ncbi:hypothetical protein J2X06_000026 [Lysobacter niastensis]|uniref:Uncharacterized protein n=2 Tax=Lysobacter niastensis TaxID=380629 RepID=A0ABU1W5V7_9GAMM|nr:hypothetical protein [Lysobacter niastensis]
MSEEKLREYGELKRFFEVWETQLFPNQFFAPDHPHHPINVLAAIEQRAGRSRALTGLKQAIGDILEGVQDLAPGQIAQLDDALRQAGALTLTLLLARQSKVFKAILRRGQIRNDTEFYLISAALSDTSSVRSETEIATLGSMVAAYEARPNNSFKPKPLRGSA